MLENLAHWFGGLPVAFQLLGYVSLLPFALAALGAVICLAENSAISLLEEHGAIKGLILLGAIAAGFLGGIFGVAALFYYAVYPQYALSVFVGLLFGLGVVPKIISTIADKREHQKTVDEYKRQIAAAKLKPNHPASQKSASPSLPDFHAPTSNAP